LSSKSHGNYVQFNNLTPTRYLSTLMLQIKPKVLLKYNIKHF